MADNNTLIEVSAFSGLVGAILSQTLTGLFAYFSDKRKLKTEVKSKYRSKQVEIAEEFYYVTGETMAVLKKSINYWKNRNDSRSQSSLGFLNKEIKGLNVQLEKLKIENWKYNLVSLYFSIDLSYNEINEANTKSHLLYLKTLDISDKLIKAQTGEDKELLYGQYNQSIFDLCSQYEMLYDMLAKDMDKIKTGLQKSFETN